MRLARGLVRNRTNFIGKGVNEDAGSQRHCEYGTVRDGTSLCVLVSNYTRRHATQNPISSGLELFPGSDGHRTSPQAVGSTQESLLLSTILCHWITER
jgi:hypothetical protein